MKIIKNSPVYNRKGQRMFSITEQEAAYIDESKIDDHFFIVENAFIVIKSKFFRQEHLVKNWTFYTDGSQVHFKRKESLYRFLSNKGFHFIENNKILKEKITNFAMGF